MRPIENTVTTRSTIGGETRTMGIDTDAVAHLMGVLTNLYTDPIAAVIREYSTNARDAMDEIGSAEPIRVTLPTRTSPVFTVQDFGVGMSTDRILDHYSLYGRSDKRNSDSVVGMLGLGCKSALTYADTFNITSVHNGIRTVAIVAKNSDGVGEIEIVDTVSTSERNGTKVSIPVKSYDVDNFESRAEGIYGYWQAGTVLIDGKAPVSLLADKHKVEGMEVYYSQGYDNHIVVMGNVAYTCKSDILSEFRRTPLVIFVPIGSVAFAPSREELFYNGKTNDFLRKIAKEIKESIQANISNVLATATTKAEAFQVRATNDTFSFLTGVKWVYNGEDIPQYVSSQSGLMWHADRYPYGKAKASRGFRAGGTEKVAYISGYKSETLPVRIKGAFVNASKDSSHKWHGVNVFILTDTPTTDWVEWSDWQEFAATLPKKAKAAPGTRTYDSRSLRRIDSNGYVTSALASDHPNDIYWPINPQQHKDNPNGDRGYTWAQMIKAGIRPVLVYKRDEKAFAEDYLIGGPAEVKTYLDNIDKQRTDDWYIGWAVTETWIKHFKGKTVLDPDLAKMVQYLDNYKNTDDHEATSKDRRTKAQALVQTFRKTYPLCEQHLSYYGSMSQAYIDYVDALYTFRKGN